MNAPPTAETVSRLLAARALAEPDAPFLLFDGERRDLALTYAETLAAAEAAVGLLEGLGAGAGTRIHLDLANCPEFVVLLFAAAI
ncbi:MAG: AMP-binding protein, partial [Solirubrobacterales bacterium]